MRKVILLMSISIDGVVAAPNDPKGLSPAREDAELKALKLEWLSHAGCHIMGRTTYEEMAGHWPHSDDAYAEPMNAPPKVVFSRTLTEAPWESSRIAGGDLAEEVAGLKREAGGDIIAWGGASFAHSLIAANLIDEYRLVVHPVLVGDGRRIFDRFRGRSRSPCPISGRLAADSSCTSMTGRSPALGPDRGLTAAQAYGGTRTYSCATPHAAAPRGPLHCPAPDAFL